MTSGKKIFIYFSSFVVIFLFCLGTFYYLVILPSKVLIEASEQIANGVAEAFNFYPRITNNNNVIFEEQAAILEIAVYSQRLVNDFDYTNTWMGSTKKLHLQGVFLAKYGFNLKNQNFSINIEKNDSSSASEYNLTFRMPEPILLSFEMENFHIMEDKDGWWNKINKTEREIAVNRLRGAAREEALSVDYQNLVKNSLESQFNIVIAELPLEIGIDKINFIWQDTNLNSVAIDRDEIKTD